MVSSCSMERNVKFVGLASEMAKKLSARLAISGSVLIVLENMKALRNVSNALVKNMQPEHPEIPAGYYCYTIKDIEYGPVTPESEKLVQIFGGTDTRSIVRLNTIPCPHWGRDTTKDEQENGFCKLLDIKDWERGTLLWDQVKECNFNLDMPEDDLQLS